MNLSVRSIQDLGGGVEPRVVRGAQEPPTDLQAVEASGPRVYSLQEVLALDLPQTPWAVGGLLRLPGVGMVYGQAGALKTALSMEFGISLASGRPVLGQFDVPTPLPVLFLQWEMPLAGFAERWQAMRPDPALPISIVCDPDLRLDDPAVIAWLMRRPERVVVVDSLVRSHRGDENASRDAADFYRTALRPLVDNGKAVLLIHHVRKPQQGVAFDPLDLIRSSSDWPAQVDTALHLKRLSEASVMALQVKSRYGPLVPAFVISLRFGEDGLRLRYEGPATGDEGDGLRSVREAVLALVSEHSLATGEVEKHLRADYGAARVRRALKALQAEGLIYCSRDGRRKLWRSAEVCDSERETSAHTALTDGVEEDSDGPAR
jgi:DNA-binding transcriptional ArsR family regulator